MERIPEHLRKKLKEDSKFAFENISKKHKWIVTPAHAAEVMHLYLKSGNNPEKTIEKIKKKSEKYSYLKGVMEELGEEKFKEEVKSFALGYTLRAHSIFSTLIRDMKELQEQGYTEKQVLGIIKDIVPDQFGNHLLLNFLKNARDSILRRRTVSE